MAREWLLRGVDPEELKPTQKEEAPQTVQSRWENFWYHHKWKFWLAVFAVAVLAVGVWQMVTRNDPDYYLLLLTENSYTSSELAAMEALLAPYGEDLDDDGQVEIHVENCLFSAVTDSSKNTGNLQVQAHLMAGDRMFFIFEPDAYEVFEKTVISKSDLGMDFFATLPSEQGGTLKDGKLWDWQKDSRPIEELKKRSKSLLFAVRTPGGSAANAEELHQQSLALLERFVTDTKPE